MSNPELIQAYKNARNLITKNPADKDKIINDYIDLVVKINDYNNNKLGSGAGSTINSGTGYGNPELNKMLRNPLEISIYNNFQRYGNTSELNKQYKQQTSSNYNDSAKFLVNMANYTR